MKYIRKFKAEEFPDKYFKHNVDKMLSPEDQKKELRYFKNVVNNRLTALKKSSLSNLADLRMQEMPYRDVIMHPERFSVQEQLAAFARVAYTNISVRGLREEQKEMERAARDIFGDYKSMFDDAAGFAEFMGALRYSGLMEKFGSDVAQRIYEDDIEEGGASPARVLGNYERYVNLYK